MSEYDNDYRDEYSRWQEHDACVNNAVTAVTAEETRKYAKMAKELYPDDFDTLRVCALAEIRKAYDDPVTKYLQYGEALMRADEIIKEDKEGKFALIGDWYRSLYGIPYLRLKRSYAKALLDCGLISPAKKQYEGILTLTHYDGYGDRYILAAVYAFTGDCSKMKRLLKKYKDPDDGGLSLPASVCYFKNGDTSNAKKYLFKALDGNENYRSLVKKSINENFRKRLFEIYNKCVRQGSFLAGSYEECVYGVVETMFLYDSVPAYFHWARLVTYTE